MRRISRSTRLDGRSAVAGIRRRALVVALSLAAIAVLVIASTAFASPSDIREKKAEAKQVLAQIRQIDTSLDRAVEAYNAASYKLSQLDQEVETNRRHLGIARHSYAAAQKALAARVVGLYQDGEDNLMEVMLGASNLDDLLTRIDTARQVSAQDVQIVRQVKRAGVDLREEKAQLERARSAQRQVVADRASRKRSIESQLDERKRLYDSVKAEVQKLEAQERARQRRLAAEARAREREARTLAAAAGITIPAFVASPQGIGINPPSQLGSQAVAIALQYLGRPYVWGAAGPDYFDCSGLITYVYGQLGVSLPHYAAAQFGYGAPVSFDQLQPGDLVFFHGLSHVGMYIGNGQFVHAPHTGDVVKISSIYDSWYRYGFDGARRIG